MTPHSLSVTLWNVEWAKPGTARGRLVQARLNESAPEVMCVTEGYPEIFPTSGHVICSDADYGYGTTKGRRKVMHWSRHSWATVDCFGHGHLPSGRFITGVTETTIGTVRFMHDLLMNTLQPTLRVVTDGRLAGVDAQSIDHLAVSDELEALSVEAFSNLTTDGKKLSDHFGLCLTLQQERITSR